MHEQQEGYMAKSARASDLIIVSREVACVACVGLRNKRDALAAIW
jgi:hypothetical protein